MCLDDRGSASCALFRLVSPEAERARRGFPDPAVCLTEGLRPHVKLGDLRSARWQGLETLTQRACRRWESREVLEVPFPRTGLPGEMKAFLSLENGYTA